MTKQANTIGKTMKNKPKQQTNARKLIEQQGGTMETERKSNRNTKGKQEKHKENTIEKQREPNRKTEEQLLKKGSHKEDTRHAKKTIETTGNTIEKQRGNKGKQIEGDRETMRK